ncbi:molybdopterin-dependent oxidoreductase [Acidisphaera sp. L21]|uniref:molybdopterin-dependent oxidoreductase n=1 Tax=Acidisphaera sp. L21 TaxID=1641851 RepID=UPI00131D2EBC|nr:molybdopterin-dependent oxidoreductase [Acidisphaera sp. L21]
MLNTGPPNDHLIVRSSGPYNAEPPLGRLRASMRTAQRDLYVRNHGNVPHLDAANHRLRVVGRVSTPLDLSMADLRGKFSETTVTAVMQCAGNRRADMQSVRPTSGDPWAPGAIGNAAWTGVALAEVLRAAGVTNDPSLHVAFEACDEVDMPDEGRFTYGASIPVVKALSPEVLLAYAVNGEPLAPEHGFPLRVVVPGFAGVRSPKWLSTVTVQDRPSDNHMQQRDYKLLPPDVTAETVDWDKGMTIYEMPLNAAICEPALHAKLRAGPSIIRGYAVATAREVARVDVSSDGGRTWVQAVLDHDVQAPWSWTFWSAEIDLAVGKHELIARAWDSAGQTQPSLPDDTWNFKGYLSAAWHRVRVSVS